MRDVLAANVRVRDGDDRSGGPVMTKTPKWLDDAQCVWDNSVAPGGFVCEVCRLSVESEPCREHQPGAFAESQR